MGALARRGLWLEPRSPRPSVTSTQTGRCSESSYYRAPDLRLGATPDYAAVIDDQAVNLQLKVIAKPEHDKHWGDGVPLHYSCKS